MSCYHPLKAFCIGYRENGKKDLKITGYDVAALVSSDCASWRVLTVEPSKDGLLYDEPFYRGSDGSWFALDPITIPCGQCIGCRIQKSREWADRCMMEASYYDSNYFITLTYDDENVPVSEYFSSVTGELCESLTLVKRDLQLFFKRLRKRFSVLDVNGKVTDESKIRFFACGEYGDQTLRPHYHAIVFNLHLDDLVFDRLSRDGFPIFVSPTIGDLWPYGLHKVSNVSWETCAYVARYCTKKLTGSAASYYDYFQIEPQFSLMSRKPGLARRFYEEKARSVYENGVYKFNLSTPSGPVSFKPPKYFDNLYDLEEPEVLSKIKQDQMQMAQDAITLKLSKTDLSYLELLEVEENAFKHKTNSLLRSSV